MVIYGLGQFGCYAFLILDSLSSGANHGYGMIEDVQRRKNVRMYTGAFFGAVMKLDERGWIEALPRIEERRQPYQMTHAGRDILRMYQAQQTAKN